jgi:hypothetical protein
MGDGARRDPMNTKLSNRSLTRIIYAIALRMEELSDELDGRWVITAEPHCERIVVELADAREERAAEEMVAMVIAEFSLA